MMAGGYMMDESYMAYLDALWYVDYATSFYDDYDGKVVAAYIYAPTYDFSTEQAIGVCIYSFCGGTWLYYDSSAFADKLSDFNFEMYYTGENRPMMNGISMGYLPSETYAGDGLQSYCYDNSVSGCTSMFSGLRLMVGKGFWYYPLPAGEGYNGMEVQVTTFHSNSDINAVQTVSFTFEAAAIAPLVGAAGALVCGLVTATAM